MKAYIGSKIILAEPMDKISFEVKHKGAMRKDGETQIVSGYHVQYADGYHSWSPKATFEEAYREISLNEKGLVLFSDHPMANKT